MDFKQQHLTLLQKIKKLIGSLVKEKKDNYQRVLPMGDYFIDRFDKARLLGFGEGTSCYDNVLILGDVKVGKNTWIGPNVILDGAGGLSIGDNCSISAGVQIYSHDSVDWAISGGEAPYQYQSTQIGSRCYIGPNVIIQKGIKIGEGVVIGANSFVNRDVPDGAKAYGSPIKINCQELV